MCLTIFNLQPDTKGHYVTKDNLVLIEDVHLVYLHMDRM